MSKYTYTATVINIHDGDTLRCDIDLGFNVILKNRTVRLWGINAPELATPAGKAARDYLAETLPAGSTFTLCSHEDQTEKYGRILGSIYLTNPLFDGPTVNDDLVTKGYATPYTGKGPR